MLDSSCRDDARARLSGGGGAPGLRPCRRLDRRRSVDVAEPAAAGQRPERRLLPGWPGGLARRRPRHPDPHPRWGRELGWPDLEHGVRPVVGLVRRPSARMGGGQSASRTHLARSILPPAIIATSDGGATWRAQSTGIYGIQNQANTTLNSVRFVDDQHGWAVGVYWHDGAYHALILATGDGGAHWVQQGPRTIGLTLWDVDFADALHGWAVGQTNAGPSILVTSDGGATWRFQETTARTLLRSTSSTRRRAGPWAASARRSTRRTGVRPGPWAASAPAKTSAESPSVTRRTASPLAGTRCIGRATAG